MKLKVEITQKLQELMDFYSGKAIDYEEKNNDEKSQEMMDIYDKIESFKEYLENL